MRRTYINITVSWLAIISLLLMPVTVKAESPDGAMTETLRKDTFSWYAKEFSDKKVANSPIELLFNAARLGESHAEAGEDGVNLQSDIGEDAKHCFMEWTAEIPADAVYYLELVYKSAEDKINKPQIKIELDGKVPYNELSAYSLSRVYSDAEEMRSDSLGNNLIPKQKVIDVWQTERLCDTSGISSSKLTLYLQQGAHNIRISCEQENVSVKSLTLAGNKEVKTDAQMSEEYKDKGIKEIPSFYKEFQAEKAYQKSEASLYPQYDRTSPATVPYDPVLIRRNTMGGSGWSENGMWISYKTEDIPQDGLYYLTIKYRQKEAVGIPSFRNIYINGEIPSSSYENVAFPYGVDWQRQTIVDSSGAPCPIYLKKGQNEIKFQIGEGKYGRVLSVVEDSCNQLNDLYAQMVMITGTSPDKYRDYNLEKEIPGLIDQLSEQAKQLEDAAQIFDALSGEKSSESETIRDMVRRLESLIANPRTIHKRISNYRDGISSLYSWLDDMTYQPLEMDYFIIHSRESELPSPKAKFMASVIHTITTFFLSFAQDYNTVGENSTGNSINVWVNMGRDQIQIIRNMVTDKFTPQSGISVRLSVVQTGFIEATLAGSGPDIALGIARGQPVNLASRNALLDFDGYDRFGEIKKRFSDTASVPYEFNDKTYALPCSQTFYMMFYRKDILQKLGIEIPKTWDELNSITPKLQRSHMSIGLPYSIISAAAAVDTGLGAKDLYATLLLQNGGQFYNAEHTSTALDSEAAVNAFKTWCDFYTQYGFDLVYDFYTRFKNGEMPIGIASFEMFNTLSLGAREINGLWGMAPIPGILKEDGTIDNSEAGAGTAAVIFKNAGNPQSCYEFLDWWTGDDVQIEFCRTLENTLGPGGRYATANINAFNSQPWTRQQLSLLNTQRKMVQELPEIPGSYYVSRSIDNAFRAVLFDKKNPRETFQKENRSINREIERKRRELGLS